MARDVLTPRRSRRLVVEAPTAAGTAARLRIGVHRGSAALLTLSALGWLDEALFAEGVLVDWVACAEGGRTSTLLAIGAIDLAGAAAEELPLYSPSVLVIDGSVDGGDALVAARGVAERQPALVATVLQALEQVESWSRAHPAAASGLLARARRSLADALRPAPRGSP